jgi:carbon monoxide dehydrogenase subunit G
VWAFVARYENWADLFPGYQRHRSTGEKRSRWTLKGDLGMFSRLIEVDVGIVNEQPAGRIDFAVEGVTENLTGRGAFGLHPMGRAGSELTLCVDLHAGGPMAPMIDALLKPRLPAMVEGFARALAQRLEERHPAAS